MNELWWMGTDLTLVLALVTAINTLDTQTPVVRILKFDGISRIACVRLLAHGQQSHLLAALLSSQPGHLKIQNDPEERCCRIRNFFIRKSPWLTRFHYVYKLVYNVHVRTLWRKLYLCPAKTNLDIFSIQTSSSQSIPTTARKNINRCRDNRSCTDFSDSYRQFSCVRVYMRACLHHIAIFAS